MVRSHVQAIEQAQRWTRSTLSLFHSQSLIAGGMILQPKGADFIGWKKTGNNKYIIKREAASLIFRIATGRSFNQKFHDRCRDQASMAV